MYHFTKWIPNEKDIEVLIPIVKNRETAINCLRALAKRQRDEIIEKEMGSCSWTTPTEEGEDL